MYRVQFDIDESMFERVKPYVKKKSALGVFGLIAFEEWVKRREGREGRAISQDEERIRKIVEEILNDRP